MISQPYALFLGDAPDALACKVGQGIRQWRPEACVAQVRLPECAHDLGLPDLDPEAAAAAGAKTLVVGVANRGGIIGEAWIDLLERALTAGMDVASGLHQRLSAVPRLVAAAEAGGRRLHDVRVPPAELPIASGRARAGSRCLALGTDCSVGKMYTALAMERELRARGRAATFRATGQTGILIAGEGIPLDAVVADFMAGAIEAITPANDDDHIDLIEGQGSLFHASFSGVTLALLHGAQPDTLVLCHEPTRKHLRGLPDYAPRSLSELRELALPLAHIVNPKARVIGASVNTAALDAASARDWMQREEASLGIPVVDPLRDGVARLVDQL